MGAEPLTGSGKLKYLDGYMPEEEQGKIAPPALSRTEAGVEISYFFEVVSYGSYPSGEMSLRQMKITVQKDNMVKVDASVVWQNNGE